MWVVQNPSLENIKCSFCVHQKLLSAVSLLISFLERVGWGGGIGTVKKGNFNGAFEIILNTLGTIKSFLPFSAQQGQRLSHINLDHLQTTMVKQYFKIFTLLFVSAVLVATVIKADQCEVILLKRCKEVYKEALDASFNSGKVGHCSRLQVWKCGSEMYKIHIFQLLMKKVIN